MELDGRVALVEGLPYLLRHQVGVAVLEQARVPGDEGRGGRPAEELPERQPGPLRGEVPEGNVDPGEREHGDAVSPEEVHRLLELAHQGRDVGRVPADDDGSDRLVDHRPDRRHAVVAERLAPADGAVFGLDPHEQDVERAPRPPAPSRGRPAAVVRDGEGDRLDARNLHS